MGHLHIMGLTNKCLYGIRGNGVSSGFSYCTFNIVHRYAGRKSLGLDLMQHCAIFISAHVAQGEYNMKERTEGTVRERPRAWKLIVA